MGLHSRRWAFRVGDIAWFSAKARIAGFNFNQHGPSVTKYFTRIFPKPTMGEYVAYWDAYGNPLSRVFDCEGGRVVYRGPLGEGQHL